MVAAAPAKPPAKVDVSDGVAVVIRAEGVRWEMDGGRAPKEGDVLPKGRLAVREGRATFAMLTGVTVVVEGPADIDLLSVDRIACHRGKLRARVPDGAEGFVVSGPGTAVVDLGTEFGINVQADGKSRGKVFEGEVEAALLGTSGALRYSRLLVEASGAFEIDPETGPHRAPRRARGIRRALQAGPRAAGASPGLSGRDPRRAADVLLAVRVRRGGEGRQRGRGGPPLLVRGPVRVAESAAGNRCAVFEPGQNNQCLLMDGSWKPGRPTGYAIELWFLPESIGIQALVSMIAPKDTTSHLSLIELTASNRLTLVRPASVRFLYRWPTGRGGGDNVFSDSIYVPYRWHHLVAQLAGERMELYLDGVVQASQVVKPSGSTAPCQLILGRLTTLTSSKQIHHTGFRRPFVGLMDEIALYDRPLTADEIRAHHALAARPARTD